MSALAYISRTKAGDRIVLVDLSLCAIAGASYPALSLRSADTSPSVGAFTVLSAKALSSFLNLIFLDRCVSHT